MDKEKLSFIEEFSQDNVDRVHLQYRIVKKLLIKPEDNIELFYTVERNQLEFYGIVKVNYEFDFKLPARLKALIGKRNVCKLYLGTDFGLLRFYTSEKLERALDERAEKGVIGSVHEIPVELKFYKHICGVRRKAKGVALPAPGVCNICGSTLKSKKPDYKLLPCVRCSAPLVSRYCTNCGLKTAVQNYLCAACNQKASYISLYKKWYCYKCEKYL
jgi:hypothetical protein